MPPNFVTPTDLPTALADLTNLDGRGSRVGWDVKEYGAKGDGSTDDSAAILAAIAAAVAAGGGVVFFPAGTFMTSQTITIYSNVTLLGAGVGATVVKLTSGANKDLLKTDQYDTLHGGGTQGGPARWALRNMTFDGNGANQTTGKVANWYGKEYIIDSCHFRAGRTGGVHSEWGSGGSNMEANWNQVKIYNCVAGRHLDFEGPDDSQFSNMVVFMDGSITPAVGNYGIRFGARSGGAMVTNTHVWGAFEVGWLFDVGSDGCLAVNCEAEGCGTNVWLNSGSNIFEGKVFGSNGTGFYSVAHGGPGEIGVKLGTASTTSVSGNVVRTFMFNWVSGDTPVSFANDAGNQVETVSRTGTAAAAVSGALNFKSFLRYIDPSSPGFSQMSTPFVGAGVPNSTLGVVGSYYLRTDGGTGTHLYFKTGASTWTALTSGGTV